MVLPIRSWIEAATGMQNSRKLSRLSAMSESEFREDVLVPLLRKMGYQGVRERHGPDEYGKDITFIEVTPLARTNYAVVAKAGDISGAARGKDNLATVMTQVRQAFEIPFYDAEGKRREVIGQVIVWATGKLSNSAETQIVEALSQQYRSVSFKDGQATVELLDTHIPTFFAVGNAYVSDYFSAAKDHYSRVEELRTLGTSSDRYKLPAIFVPPVLRPYIPRLKDSKLENKPYQFSDILAGDSNLLVAGQMGAGKSSLLRRLLIATIEENEAAGSTLPIPVLVRAKDLNLEDTDCIATAIQREISTLSPHSEPDSILSQGPNEGVLLLVDGIDELKEEPLILKALSLVSEYANRSPSSRTIAAMRTMDILDNTEVLSEFSILEVEELSQGQMGTFIENWFGKENPLGVKLKKFLQDPLSLQGLPTTPLTLAIVAILYASGAREIPANLTELFTKYVELALGKWDEARDVSQLFEWKVKEFLLRGLAWKMHNNRSITISPREVDETTFKLADDRGLTVDPGLFRQEVADRSELLVLNEDGQYEFKHRAFQDFFVGVEIVNRAAAIEIVVGNFLDSWWEQALFFACGLRPESSEFLEAVVSRVSPNESGLYAFAINLGMSCQASYLAPRETKRRVVSIVLDSLIASWQALSIEYHSLKEKPKLPPFLSPHLILVGLFTASAHQALGSITLASVLRDAAADYLAIDLRHLDADQRKLLEWKAFFLAVALAGSGEAHDFAAIVESGLIRDPVLHLAALVAVNRLASHSWLSSGDKRDLRRTGRFLKKSVESSRPYLKSLASSEPVLLPDPQEPAPTDRPAA